MSDHYIVVKPLPAFADMFFGGVSPEMHCRGIVPEKERLARLVDLVDEAQCPVGYLIVDGFHAFSG
jgi:hypothetical protein